MIWLVAAGAAAAAVGVAAYKYITKPPPPSSPGPKPPPSSSTSEQTAALSPERQKQHERRRTHSHANYGLSDHKPKTAQHSRDRDVRPGPIFRTGELVGWRIASGANPKIARLLEHGHHVQAGLAVGRSTIIIIESEDNSFAPYRAIIERIDGYNALLKPLNEIDDAFIVS